MLLASMNSVYDVARREAGDEKMLFVDPRVLHLRYCRTRLLLGGVGAPLFAWVKGRMERVREV